MHYVITPLIWEFLDIHYFTGVYVGAFNTIYIHISLSLSLSLSLSMFRAAVLAAKSYTNHPYRDGVCRIPMRKGTREEAGSTPVRVQGFFASKTPPIALPVIAVNRNKWWDGMFGIIASVGSDEARVRPMLFAQNVEALSITTRIPGRAIQKYGMPPKILLQLSRPLPLPFL